MQLLKARSPFIFKSQLSLVESMGLRARELTELCRYVKVAPDASIFYHTHHFLQQHQFLTPEPPNDFAYWVTEVLQEEVVGEQLASIDTVRFNSLALLKDTIAGILEKHLTENQQARKAPPGQEFYFMKCVLFNLPTSYHASNLREFSDCLKKVSIGCLYNHIFEARLRPPLGVNDFTNWLSTALGEKELALAIDRLDPYTQTMEGLRSRIVALLERRLEAYDLSQA